MCQQEIVSESRVHLLYGSSEECQNVKSANSVVWFIFGTAEEHQKCIICISFHSSSAKCQQLRVVFIFFSGSDEERRLL
ncbi:hypothetical protein RRG08_059203 [Elysia crispata]|uniref:Uncharacterized protein n=1 Tax=Elysia crispata TaxID=231223 RepID=A0AAE0ZFA7_9GAST|nr:hypothetical protein RRG08_059203 [Elysia crispata]